MIYLLNNSVIPLVMNILVSVGYYPFLGAEVEIVELENNGRDVASTSEYNNNKTTGK